jgi:AraC family transcriptional regulator
MSVPETTSAEAFWRYAGGKCLFESRGEVWRDIKAWITALPPVVDTLHIPSVSEPFLAWTTSGEIDFQEREDGQPWITNRIKKGSFFLTTGGNPYQVRWKAVSNEPFETMLVFVELPVLQRALEEVFGDDAPRAWLRDASAFNDEGLNSLLGMLREELMREQASPLFVQGIAQAIAVYLARNLACPPPLSHIQKPQLTPHRS